MWRSRQGNKYGSTSCVYNGKSYQSKKEAGFAQELDFRVKAGDIKSWEKQIRVSLDVNGFHICNYIVDFKVTENDGSIHWYEVKGFSTDVFRLKRLLFEATYLHQNPDEKYTVVY